MGMFTMAMLSDCLGKMRPCIASRVEKPPVERIRHDPELHSTLFASTCELATRPRPPAHWTESDQCEYVFYCESIRIGSRSEIRHRAVVWVRIEKHHIMEQDYRKERLGVSLNSTNGFVNSLRSTLTFIYQTRRIVLGTDRQFPCKERTSYRSLVALGWTPQPTECSTLRNVTVDSSCK
jgi:hypothetical protein